MNRSRDTFACGPLSCRAVRRAACVAVLTLLAVGSASATGPSTITFTEHAAGTVIDTEYASLGVRFGKATDLGAPALAGAWDCGAPQVKEPTSDGPPPKLAQAPVCGGRSGTVAAFAHPRRTIRLVVEATPSTDRSADVLAIRGERNAAHQHARLDEPLGCGDRPGEPRRRVPRAAADG